MCIVTIINEKCYNLLYKIIEILPMNIMYNVKTKDRGICNPPHMLSYFQINHIFMYKIKKDKKNK